MHILDYGFCFSLCILHCLFPARVGGRDFDSVVYYLSYMYFIVGAKVQVPFVFCFLEVDLCRVEISGYRMFVKYLD